MAIIWTEVHDNFKNLLEDSVTGMGSLSSVTNTFTESDYIDIKTEPTSIYNGSYSLQLDSINGAQQDYGTGIVDFDYDVRLQIAFELSSRSNKTDYNNAIKDIEEIIRQRLKVTSWANTNLLRYEFRNGNRFMTFDTEALERFSFVELVFNVTGRANLNT